MENQNLPEPNQIPNVPQNGSRVHLFRKILTASDFGSLVLVQPEINIFEGLPQTLRRELNNGLEVRLFTPDIAANVHLKRGQYQVTLLTGYGRKVGPILPE